MISSIYARLQATFTRQGPLVRSQYRPPDSSNLLKYLRRFSASRFSGWGQTGDKLRLSLLTPVGIAILCGCNGSQDQAKAPVTVAPPAVQKSAPIPVMHIVTYGQSLSLGERAVVSFPTDLTIPGPYQDVGYMFAGGTRPSDLSALVTFEESTTDGSQDDWNIGTPGETPLYGALLTIAGLPGMHIGSTAGRGGTNIINLSRGTAPYQRLLAQVTAGQTLSKGTDTVTILWLQGESDAGNTNYASEFEQLVMDLDADVRAITHQGPVQFYVCLPAVPEIAAAQQSVAAAMPQVHIACNTADLDHSDGLHLTALSSRQAGGMLGNAILRDVPQISR